MINPFKEVNWNPDRAQRRSFAKSLMIGFPCVAAILLLAGGIAGKGWNFGLALWIGGIGAAVGMLLLALPAIARPFYAAWYFLACCIGIIVGNVLLAVIYYVFFTGFGLTMRAFGRRVIRKTVEKSAKTYWRDAGSPPEPRRYFRQF